MLHDHNWTAPKAAPTNRILVVGSPRSGTTWTARALGHCLGVHYIHEPDDDERDPFAKFATRGLGHLPSVAPGERWPGYEMLWEIAFAGGWPHHRFSRYASRAAAMLPAILARRPLVLTRRTTHRRHQCSYHLVKSVRTLFSTEWIADRYQPQVLVVLRDPLNKLGGWLRLGWGSDGIDKQPIARARLEPLGLWPAPPRMAQVENAIWTICARDYLLRDAAARHPDWHVVWHEDLCVNTVEGFRELAASFGLPWSEAVTQYLDATNRPGTGWDVLRVASEEVEGWRRSLTGEQVRIATATIDRFEAATGLGFSRGTVATAN